MLPAQRLAQRYLERHPEAATEVLITLQPGQLAEMLAGLAPAAAVALTRKLPVLSVARCLSHLGPEQVAALLTGMPLRLVAETLGWISAGEREAYLAVLPAASAASVRAALKRMPDSIAALIDRHASSFPLDTTIGQVFAALEQELDESGCHIYLTDAQQRFVGTLPVRLLLNRHPRTRLGSLKVRAVAVLPEAARCSSVVAHPDWQQFSQLPVVDTGGRFVGVLRRAHLTERSREPRPVSRGVLDMWQALMEGYTLANRVLLDLLMRGL